MGKRRHNRCATPGCHNIIPLGGKRGAICGVCKRREEERQPTEEELAERQPDDGKLTRRFEAMRQKH